jgi:hypothetical protein
MTRKHKVFLVATALVVVALAVLYPAMSYWLADYEYNRLIRLHVGTKTEVERVLFLYSKHQIDIKKSLWANNYKLANGEVCYQYLILGREPIDIVFDSDGNVMTIASSYE